MLFSDLSQPNTLHDLYMCSPFTGAQWSLGTNKSSRVLQVPLRTVRAPDSAASIWFETWGWRIRVKKIDFSREILKKFSFFRQFHKKFQFFQANFRFFRQFHKNFDFLGKNGPFTATSEQIILFLFKIHHFRTYFL